jgi:hypothetical protein
MTRHLRAALLTILALSLTAATGCGGGDTADNNKYVEAVNKAQTDFVASVTNVQKAPPPTPGDIGAAQKTFGDLKAAVDKIVADLKATTPPDKVKDLHSKLTSEIAKFGTAIGDINTAIGSGDLAKIQTAQTEFATTAGQIGTNVSTTITQINTKLQE